MQRVITYFSVVFAALMINFAIPRFIPGDPLTIIIGRLSYQGAKIGAEGLIEEYKRMFGLKGDMITQLISYLREVFKGNLGYSIMAFPTTVTELIMRSLPWTIGLLLTTTLVSWGVGTLIGAIAGWRGEESKLSKIFSPLALVLYTIPYWLLAMILIFMLAYTLALFPLSGGYSPWMTPSLSLDFILDLARHATLPALSIILSSLGWWFLSMRSMIIAMKGEDFMLLAEAKGLGEKRIMWKYAFRNALLPQVTALALAIGYIASGALLTEVIFAYPGIGWLLYTAIVNLDYPLIQGVTLIIILCVCTATFILDVIYPLVDPRIKVRGE
jgi:peptide/nickel transport system permease protein